jgi:hypothetical protein
MAGMENRRRVLVTALVAIAGAIIGVPGTGHAYLRRWKRSLLWLTVTLGAGILLLSYYVPNPAALDPFDFGAIPMEVRLPLFVIIVVSVVDATVLAYLEGRGGGSGEGITPTSGDEDGVACPHCGKTTDPELDFCTWCTEPLTSEKAGEQADSDAAGTEFNL